MTSILKRVKKEQIATSRAKALTSKMCFPCENGYNSIPFSNFENRNDKIQLVLLCPCAQHEMDVHQTTRNIVRKHTRTTQIIQVPTSSSENVAATERKWEPLRTQRFSIRPVCKNELGAENFERDLVLPRRRCNSQSASLRPKYKLF